LDRALPVSKRLVDLALLLGDYAQAQQRRSRVALVAGIESDLPGLPRPDPVVLLLIAHGHEAGGPRAVLGSFVAIAFRQATFAARLSRCLARTRPSSKAAQAGTFSPFDSLRSRMCCSHSAAILSWPSS